MRAFVVMVVEIEGEKNEQFVTEGKYALLRRVMFSAAEAASACVRVAPGAEWAQSIWTEDALETSGGALEDWQIGLMEAVETKEKA